jgi:hypothetical protein
MKRKRREEKRERDERERERGSEDDKGGTNERRKREWRDGKMKNV